MTLKEITAGLLEAIAQWDRRDILRLINEAEQLDLENEPDSDFVEYEQALDQALDFIYE